MTYHLEAHMRVISCDFLYEFWIHFHSALPAFRKRLKHHLSSTDIPSILTPSIDILFCDVSPPIILQLSSDSPHRIRVPPARLKLVEIPITLLHSFISQRRLHLK